MTSSSPPPSWGLSRQGTATSYGAPSRIQSWITGSAPTIPQQADQELTPDSYRIYNLEWSDLKGWLERQFPDLKLPVRGKIRNDVWTFNLPRKLSTDERNRIAVMRDALFRAKKAEAEAAAAAANGDVGHPPNNAQVTDNPRRRRRSPERQRRH
ncbi:hypothetical protein LTS15_004752 [Exophiala xenobiotica]|nr:hypothetical protein LTS15_004752 [Exophiala xenobiotica]